MDYDKVSVALKAMADPKRLKIIHLLSNGTMCACEVLEHFDFTQPTLSHHMKVLEKADIVSMNKKGQWHHYELKEEFLGKTMSTIEELLQLNKESKE